MRRRKFLIGAGSLAAAGAAAMGTGAFTSVEASRAMTVSTAGDASANLVLDPADNPHVELQSRELVINLENTNESASTELRPAFTLENNLQNEICTFLWNPWRNNDLRSPPESDGAYQNQGGPLHFSVDQTGAAGVDVQFVAYDNGPLGLIDREQPPITFQGPGRPENNWSMRDNMTNSSYTSFDANNVGYTTLGPGDSLDVAVRVVVDGDHFDGSAGVGSNDEDFIAYATTDSSELTGAPGVTEANF